MKILSLLVFLILLFSSHTLLAKNSFFQARCNLPFPEAMMQLQTAIKNRGYTISRVQHVDKGLVKMGYPSMQYKIVFFNRPEEIENIKHNYPHLVPFIPLSITIAEKKKYVSISTLKPASTMSLFSEPVPVDYFNTWQKDIKNIFSEYSSCKL